MTDKTIETFAKLAGDLTTAAMTGQGAGLSLLQAEMQALSLLMPGAALAARSEAEQQADEAATEADFDNMPV
ncbi:MAG: hypothetical protein KA139_08235 [Rhodobacteraceae bacterium]|jgi:hypothetical protein|nr:hypothetical protein [Paracoccaceae bacterium]